MNDYLIIKGAREHNLKNVYLKIPKNKMIVFTGISGSGKSSMAFDTIFAEGQRRYVESLSTYARQFLGMLRKPDMDSIEGLSPAISIDQKSVSHNPRSTVGTITEVSDYLRLLFARIGQPYCPTCNILISKMSIDEIVDKIITYINRQLTLEKIKPLIFFLLSPVVRDRKGEFSDLLKNLLGKGFHHAFIDGNLIDLETDLGLIKTNRHNIDVVIDKISVSYRDFKNKVYVENLKLRIFNSVEQSLTLASGLSILFDQNSNQRILFSEQLSCPNCGLSLPAIEPRLFSFNSPTGACIQCKGLGYVLKIDPDLVMNKKLSINEGGILPLSKIFLQTTWYSRLFYTFINENNIDSKLALGLLNADKIRLLFFGNDRVYQVEGKNRFGHDTKIQEKFMGIIGELQRRYFETDSEYVRQEIEQYMHESICDKCHGQRLKPEVLGVRINSKNVFEVGNLSIDESVAFLLETMELLSEYQKKISGEVMKEIIKRLNFLIDVGLDYLTLNRSARTLSNGESQRIRLASQIGSGLTGILYVLDEPSIGLHPKDVGSLINSLKHLRDIGNTLIVVEHDPETIMAADYIVDFGLYAGKKGGNIIYSGDIKNLKYDQKSLTAKYLFNYKTKSRLNNNSNIGDSFIEINRCCQYNLKNIDVKIPLNRLSCVTGVSGSGKSTLVVDTLYKAIYQQLGGKISGVEGKHDSINGSGYIDRIYLVDQSAIGRTPRSNPATYVGIFDFVRDIFAQTSDAKIRGYKKGRFSFNVKGGRCEKCGGAGTLKIEMQFLPDVYVNCDICESKRYNSQTLEVKYKEKNIYDILNLTVLEALDFFKNHPQIYTKLRVMADIGLDYLQLGQPATTLSGGEAQRIKLSHELAKKETGRTLYILDEPTTGLHLYDTEKLIVALKALVNKGNTVIIIEHNLDVIAQCDYIIDLGPGGGNKGGHLLYQGKLINIIENNKSLTGQYLKKYEKKS